MLQLLDALVRLQHEFLPIVFPMHPRTRKAISALGWSGRLEREGIRVVESQGFHAIQALLEHCHCVVSDSGGLQREAYFAGRRCVVPWEYASWPELSRAGWVLVGPITPDQLVSRVISAPGPAPRELSSGLFGDGSAGRQIAEHLLKALAS
jgi:UDP-N-acetylglucosamine 2-epimerase